MPGLHDPPAGVGVPPTGPGRIRQVSAGRWQVPLPAEMQGMPENERPPARRAYSRGARCPCSM